MTSRAIKRGMGEGRVGWSYFLPFPLAGGAKTGGGGVEARSSLPLCLPRPLPCPFLPLPLPLSSGLPLPLPLPLAMSVIFFLQCRAHHYSSDGHEVGKKTTKSRQRGEPSNPTQTQTQPKTNKTKKQPTEKASQKARAKVKRGETCGNATLKLSCVLLQEIVPNNTSSNPKL